MDLKLKAKITRTDIAELLASIGAPGEKQEEKIQAVKELEKNNTQGIGLHDSLKSYQEF